ncbi:MAG TPA: formylmethanofuran--tetrahydromethanopterin N-formyltransferase [Methanomicrobia archaeon]|nr:formylmethanofuran--tetrahydromethanopterin N-formyltransferase [Methanomicrobia archaeon]
MELEDTYCEAFDGLVARLCVTAYDARLVHQAVSGATALPCTVFGESEGGVEQWLPGQETPDGRAGAVIQIWVNYGPGAPQKLEYELAKRVRQGILVVPTTSAYNALDTTAAIDMMATVGHCGDGYETVEHRFGREVIVVPIMMGEFVIERRISYQRGVMGGNLWLFCTSIASALEAGERAVAAIEEIEGVIAPFGICSAGSKPETNFPEIGPTTNHWHCPTLKDRIADSQVPDGVVSIPEIVFNGLTLDSVKGAMRAAILSVQDVEGVVKISAGNYGGQLGTYRIFLREVL